MYDPTGQTEITNLKQVTRYEATFTIKNVTNDKVMVVIHPGSINIPKDRNLQDTVVL